MVMKCTTVCLLALALLESFCNAQREDGFPTKPMYQPSQRRESGRKGLYDPQVPQTFDKALTWKYPEDPTPEPQPEVPFELRYPVAAETVAVDCRDNHARVGVQMDLFGTGQLIRTEDLTLGNCGAVGEDTSARVIIFETELHGCDSKTKMTEDYLIYNYTLNYNPQLGGDLPVVRTSSAAVFVECHYPRKHNVSSRPLEPKWIPFSAVKVAEEFLYFTLKLMTDDFQNERRSHQFFLGQMINIEASVNQYSHVPLLIYVDGCVATLSPQMSSNPRYAFIENHGCFIDAKITGSASQFIPRTAENKLQFQLEAFRFKEANSGRLYITCHLKATSTARAVDGEHRACSYVSGWREAGGTDAVCGSCEATRDEPLGPSPGVVMPGSTWTTVTGSNTLFNYPRKSRDVSKHEMVEWEGDVTLGPIPVEEREVP